MAGFPIVVVGAGSAGCVLAARLAQRGASVLLLEAGPDYLSKRDLPADIADARIPTVSHDWGYRSVPGRVGRELPLPRGRLVGGCSATNACFALRGSPADYDRWAALGNEGWSFQQCLPYFCASEADADFGSDTWHGAAGPLPIRRYGPGERNAFQEALLSAATAQHPYVADHNAPGAVGVGPVPVNAVSGLRVSTALAYLSLVRGRPNFQIRSDALVDRIVVRSGRAIGVRLAASGETIEADLIVLAAGSYASPALLLRSGIGPATELAALGLRCEVDLPGVGKNLADHPWVPSPLVVSIAPGGPGFQAVVTWHSTGTDPSCAPDLQIFAQGPLNNDGRALASLCAAVLKPRSRGCVVLRSLDPAAPPVIDLGLLTDDEDLRRICEAVRHARRLLSASQFRAIAEQDDASNDRQKDDEVVSYVLANVRTYHHPTGTCAMGPDPTHAVVDSTGHVHGMEQLVVADASVMPEIPSANINLATVMIAERIAATLAL
ncbi:MAG TPA: GMC oxidoreductase [Burkholderiaceae bacterium]|nr:GMC oxidoreductase [Burkholderiaceae bacterium]